MIASLRSEPIWRLTLLCGARPSANSSRITGHARRMQPRAHEHRWSYRQRRCARESRLTRRAQRLRPGAARASRASSLQIGRTRRDRARVDTFLPRRAASVPYCPFRSPPGTPMCRSVRGGRLVQVTFGAPRAVRVTEAPSGSLCARSWMLVIGSTYARKGSLRHDERRRGSEDDRTRQSRSSSADRPHSRRPRPYLALLLSRWSTPSVAVSPGRGAEPSGRRRHRRRGRRRVVA
jgi:hypothetical protein